MIARRLAWLMAMKSAGWFKPSAAGGFPAPDAWQGWAACALLIAALAGCVALPRGGAQQAGAFAALAIYAAIMYWTYRSD